MKTPSVLGRVALGVGLIAGWAVPGWADGTWSIEVVDSSGWVGFDPSLALDASGNPHVSYQDSDFDLRYAAFDGSSWSVDVADTQAGAWNGTSLALDASGNPHISYHRFEESYSTNRDLKYATFNGSTWSVDTVHAGGNTGLYSSLALDGGNPRISYYGPGADGWGELKYASFSGSSWSTQTADHTVGITQGFFTSLALDASGHPHISYQNATDSDLKYATFNGSSWSAETVDSGGVVGQYTSLALDASGRPRISYYDSSNTALKYAAFNGSSWSVQEVDNSGAVGYHTSLAVDADGHPHISYEDAVYGDLKYATFDGCSWLVETVDSDCTAFGTSLALDADGDPRIAYHDNAAGHLKYATLTSEPTFVRVSLSDTPDVVLEDTVLFASQGGDGVPFEVVALGDLDLGTADHTFDLPVCANKTHWWLIGHADEDILYSSNVDLEDVDLFDVEPFDPAFVFTESGIRAMLEAVVNGDPVPSLEQYIWTATHHSTHAALDDQAAALWQFGSPGSAAGTVTVSMFYIPEPSTTVLLCAGAVGLLSYAWRKRRKK